MEVLNQLRSDTFDNVNSLFFKREGLISFMYALLVLIIGWVISKVVILFFAKSTNGIQYRQNRH
jgi:hypothetical protein